MQDTNIATFHFTVLLHCIICADVIIGFSDLDYTVLESDGAVRVSIGVLKGTLEREVIINLSTISQTATGKLEVDTFCYEFHP